MTGSDERFRTGTRLRHKPTGKVVTLARRKEPGEGTQAPGRKRPIPFHPGWWLEGGDGGLADFVIDAPDSDWEVVP